MTAFPNECRVERSGAMKSRVSYWLAAGLTSAALLACNSGPVPAQQPGGPRLDRGKRDIEGPVAREDAKP
jgi:hypothetical protein